MRTPAGSTRKLGWIASNWKAGCGSPAGSGPSSKPGMLVMGHIGLTPQSSSQLGGFKAQGRTLDSAKAQVEDALAVQEAGAAMILLEAIPPEVSGTSATFSPSPC